MGKWHINNNSHQKGESMSSYQKVIIMGNLGKDPEVKNLPSGSTVANFSVATSKNWNDKATGEKQEKTTWHTINVFGKMAENCGKYLTKGSSVLVEGELNVRSWVDKDENKRYSTEIIANNVQFLKNNAQKNDALKGAMDKAAKEFNVSTDSSFASEDLPF